jgi:DNA repair exonuclease SbcCD ATPase subunit
MIRTIRILCVALLTIVGLVGTTLPARADDRDEHRARCEQRIHAAQEKLRDAVQRYGEDSKKAHHRRDQLEQVKRDCPDYREEHHDMDHHDMEHHDDPH